MIAWLRWIFRGYQEDLGNRVAFADALAKLESTAAKRHESYEKQFADLRALITARPENKKPETIRARNFREVQAFLGDDDAAA